MIRLRSFVLMAAAALALAACAPSVSPLYRDYEVRAVAASEEASPDVYARIRAALAEAGWTETEADAPNIVSTEPRQVSDWGLFRTEVALDVAPIGDRHVRVLFHPIRYSFLGGRTKISYLGRGARRSILPDLNAAFEEQGFEVLGTAKERDEQTRSDGEET